MTPAGVKMANERTLQVEAELGLTLKFLRELAEKLKQDGTPDRRSKPERKTGGGFEAGGKISETSTSVSSQTADFPVQMYQHTHTPATCVCCRKVERPDSYVVPWSNPNRDPTMGRDEVVITTVSGPALAKAMEIVDRHFGVQDVVITVPADGPQGITIEAPKPPFGTTMAQIDVVVDAAVSQGADAAIQQKGSAVAVDAKARNWAIVPLSKAAPGEIERRWIRPQVVVSDAYNRTSTAGIRMVRNAGDAGNAAVRFLPHRSGETGYRSALLALEVDAALVEDGALIDLAVNGKKVGAFQGVFVARRADGSGIWFGRVAFDGEADVKAFTEGKPSDLSLEVTPEGAKKQTARLSDVTPAGFVTTFATPHLTVSKTVAKPGEEIEVIVEGDLHAVEIDYDALPGSFVKVARQVNPDGTKREVIRSRDVRARGVAKAPEAGRELRLEATYEVDKGHLSTLHEAGRAEVDKFVTGEPSFRDEMPRVAP